MGMVALNCPNCGAEIELDDSREFGFCNYCGTKVMQEKIVVEHTGSVSIDNKELANKQLKKAREARLNKDWEDVSKYYDLYSDVFDANVESKFYIAYSKMMTTLSNVDYQNKYNKAEVILNLLDKLASYYQKEDKDVILEMCKSIDELVNPSNLVYEITKNGYGNVVKSDLVKTRSILYLIQYKYCMFLEDINGIDPHTEYIEYVAKFYLFALEELVMCKVYRFKNLHEDSIMSSVADAAFKTAGKDNSIADAFQEIFDIKNSFNIRDEIDEKYYKILVDKINELVNWLEENNYPSVENLRQRLKEIDEQFVVVNQKQKAHDEKVAKNGCYVATAVYGSYDCPEVWTLRRYRDNQLAKSWYGRLFIHTYYAISPTLVKWFGDTQWFKNMWKPKLDSMVKELQEQGVENTPYDDIDW